MAQPQKDRSRVASWFDSSKHEPKSRDRIKGRTQRPTFYSLLFPLSHKDATPMLQIPPPNDPWMVSGQ